MQPKDSPERTPENDRRMRRKLDKMMKELVPKQPIGKRLLIFQTDYIVVCNSCGFFFFL